MFLKNNGGTGKTHIKTFIFKHNIDIISNDYINVKNSVGGIMQR